MTRSGFVERTLEGFVKGMAHALEAEKMARADGLLQRLDPRVKVIGLPALIVAAVVAHKLTVILAILAVGLTLAILSRIPLSTLAARIWTGVFLFTGVIAAPAIFLTPGPSIYRLPLLHADVTATGLRSATYLVTRAQTAATLASLLVLCTPWTHVLKALRVLRVPIVMVVIFGMTHRYIFLLLETAQEMFLARRSRMVGKLHGQARRKVAAATAGGLLSRTFLIGEEVYLAMQSRGFNGEVYLLSDFAMRGYDYAGIAALLGLSAAAMWWGR